jgi:hypothetical protein
MEISVLQLVTRECCDPLRDFVYVERGPYAFCRHCGRHWRDRTVGQWDNKTWEPLPLPYEPALLASPRQAALAGEVRPHEQMGLSGNMIVLSGKPAPVAPKEPRP